MAGNPESEDPRSEVGTTVTQFDPTIGDDDATLASIQPTLGGDDATLTSIHFAEPPHPYRPERQREGVARSVRIVDTDPLRLKRHQRHNLTRLKLDYPQGDRKKIKKFYKHQNELIDQYLHSGDEECLHTQDLRNNAPKVKFAIGVSFVVNVFLLVIQVYAAISTKSLSLYATATDAMMDVVSSIIILVTSRMATRPRLQKYPVGRTRAETTGIVCFCALMTAFAIQIIVESAKTLCRGHSEPSKLEIVPLVFLAFGVFAKACLGLYCFILRRYPAARIFMIDHANDLVMDSFGLVMAVVSSKLDDLWWFDPGGALFVAVIVLTSWAWTAQRHILLLVGRAAPSDFRAKLIYVAITHDPLIRGVETCHAYHAGEHYYVEVDILMDESTPLRVSHNVGQSLQRKLEGLAAVERAFVHVDYRASKAPEVIEETEKLSYSIRIVVGSAREGDCGIVLASGSSEACIELLMKHNLPLFDLYRDEDASGA